MAAGRGPAGAGNLPFLMMWTASGALTLDHVTYQPPIPGTG